MSHGVTEDSFPNTVKVFAIETDEHIMTKEFDTYREANNFYQLIPVLVKGVRTEWD